MGSWIGPVGVFVAAVMAVSGGGHHHHTATHHISHPRAGAHAPARPASNPTSNPTSGTGGAAGGQTQAPVEQISVPLSPMPQGSLTLTVDPQTQLVQATVNLYGLAPGTQHQVALFANGNTAQPAFTFPDVTVDGDGQVAETVTSNEQAPQGLPQSVAFRVYLEPSSAGPSRQIASAQRVAPEGGSTRETMAFQSVIGRSGHAQLTYDPATQKLTVSLSMSGLAAGSRHAAHIHTGSCQVQGPVAYSLPDLVADAAGVASVKTTFSVTSPPPASGWYVNVHDGDMNDILQANGQPGPLFQPLACGNVQTN